MVLEQQNKLYVSSLLFLMATMQLLLTIVARLGVSKIIMCAGLCPGLSIINAVLFVASKARAEFS